jgi:hypothetical protein
MLILLSFFMMRAPLPGAAWGGQNIKRQGPGAAGGVGSACNPNHVANKWQAVAKYSLNSQEKRLSGTFKVPDSP